MQILKVGVPLIICLPPISKQLPAHGNFKAKIPWTDQSKAYIENNDFAHGKYYKFIRDKPHVNGTQTFFFLELCHHVNREINRKIPA